MGFFDFIKGLIASLGGIVQSPPVDQPADQPTNGDGQGNSPQTSGSNPSPSTGRNPDRHGSFIIADIYPRDLGPNPPFKVLPGLTVMDKEVIGCYVKASEGLGWGASNEAWFKRAWAELKRVGGDRNGVDWFRGCYHFLRFSVDGAKQADYFCNLIEAAGGIGPEDLMPWVDVEEGGQGNWAGGERLEDIKDPAKRKRLAAEVTKCTTDFITRVKQRFPGIKVGLYGRGVFRDLQMTNARFGADAVCNPAYTKTMPPMDKYGWPLKDIIEWQLCGDGYVVAKGYPSLLPGWGKTDYSAVINGSQRVGMADVRRRCLAWPR
jgi:GH25 family lysozyme M1 (1,4-beta-N-acetylmuramidase)